MPISSDILSRLKARDPELKILNFSRQHPDLTAVDMKDLAEALRNNPYVTRLVLCENKIGDEGACILAAILPTLPSLIELDVSINEISDEGAMALFRVTTLKYLDIAANHVTDRVAMQLLDNRSLHAVDLDGTGVTDKLVEQINEALSANEQKEGEQLKQELAHLGDGLPLEGLRYVYTAATMAATQFRMQMEEREHARLTPPVGGP